MGEPGFLPLRRANIPSEGNRSTGRLDSLSRTDPSYRRVLVPFSCPSVRGALGVVPRALLRSLASHSHRSQSPPPKFETERISAKGRRISEVGISPVAF